MAAVLHIIGDQADQESASFPAFANHLTWVVRNPNWPNVVSVVNLFDVIIWTWPGLAETASDSIQALTHSGAPPLIVLADEADEAGKVALLGAGAAYCLSGIIASRELSARIQALAARHRPATDRLQVWCVGEWLIDVSGKRLIDPDLQIAALTPVEFELLHLFIESRGRVLTRPFLLDRLGRSGAEINNRTVDVYVSRLRHKLRGLGAGDAMTIKAVWNEGYVCQTRSRPASLYGP